MIKIIDLVDYESEPKLAILSEKYKHDILSYDNPNKHCTVSITSSKQIFNCNYIDGDQDFFDFIISKITV